MFLPLYSLFLLYGKVFRLSFGPKTFVVVSDPDVAKDILLTNAKSYSKGLLAEILEFVMGTGLIPADGEVWRVRRRAIVPALHKRYVNAMVGLFADSASHGADKLATAAAAGQAVEMESFFSRLSLDIIGKAVFNYSFDSLTHDDPVIAAVYCALREAEHRSIAIAPYWNLPLADVLVPRQRAVKKAIATLNATLDTLVGECRAMVERDDEAFVEEYLNRGDPSILRFLIASGERVSSKQLRDDLMTMLVAGHETTAAVLTWTFYLLARHPEAAQAVRDEVEAVLGDSPPDIEGLQALRYTTRVVNESMRLYPQPPVLLRRALEDVRIGAFDVPAGTDVFIATWNLHRSPSLWARPHDFDPSRFGPLDAPGPSEFTTGYKYIPFGGGPRKCVGDQFAMLESVAAVAVLCRRFDFVLDPDGPEVGMTTGATIHTSHGLHLRLTERHGRGGGGGGGGGGHARPGEAPQQQGGEAGAAAGGAVGVQQLGGSKCPMGFGGAEAKVAR